MKLQRNVIQLNCDLNKLVDFFKSNNIEISLENEETSQDILTVSEDSIAFIDTYFCNSVFMFSKKDNVFIVNYASSFLSEKINIDLDFLGKFTKLVNGDFYFSIYGRTEYVIYAKCINGEINYERISTADWDTENPTLLSIAELKGLKKVKGKFKEKALDDLKWEVMDGLSSTDSEYSLLLSPEWYKNL